MRAPSLTSRSDRLQQRLPITQHFGKVGMPAFPTTTTNALTWNYHLGLLPFCLHSDTQSSPTPISGAHLTLTLPQKPDWVFPGALPSENLSFAEPAHSPQQEVAAGGETSPIPGGEVRLNGWGGSLIGSGRPRLMGRVVSKLKDLQSSPVKTGES